jgi:hypothetical protein
VLVQTLEDITLITKYSYLLISESIIELVLFLDVRYVYLFL